MTPKVSVIIPAYNHSRFLAQAIRSARAQEGRHDVEIVVVDDDSTDDTPQVLNELAGTDLRIIKHKHAGPAASRNRGISESRGEWVAFLDADDYWLPGKLAAQLQELEADPTASFAYSGALIVDDEGKTLQVRRAEAHACLASQLAWGNLITTSSMMVRRSAIFEVGLFHESLNTIGEDWDAWLRLSTNYKGVCIPDPLVAMRFSLFDDKYKARDLEFAMRRVMQRFFQSLDGRRDLASLATQKKRIISWHLSVIAKSHLERWRLRDFSRCALQSILAHPIKGLSYLLPVHAFGNGMRDELKGRWRMKPGS